MKADLLRMQREHKQLLVVNEDFQMKFDEFKHREQQFQNITREFREKSENLNFEREKIALKEEQFLKQVQKQEADFKLDMRRLKEKHEALMHQRIKEKDRKIEDLED